MAVTARSTTSFVCAGAFHTVPSCASSLGGALDETRGRSETAFSDASTRSASSSPAESIAEGVVEEWTERRVLKLGTELLEGFHTEHFQSELKALLAKSPNGICVPGRMELALMVQREVLPKYGFPGTFEGVEAMLDVVAAFSLDEAVSKMINDIDKSLGVPTNETGNGRLALLVDKDEKASGRPMKAAKLSRTQVLMLGGELLDAFRAPEFQEVLKVILANSTSQSVVLERAELAMRVQSKVLPKYGIPGTPEGLWLMLEMFAPHAGDWLVSSIVDAIDESLGQAGGTTLATLASLND